MNEEGRTGPSRLAGGNPVVREAFIGVSAVRMKGKAFDRRARSGVKRPQSDLFFDWLEAGEHLLCFRERFQRHAFADGKHFVPEREHVGILVRSVDCGLRFPFRYFDDRAVAATHDGGYAVGHESFAAQKRDPSPDKLQELGLFVRLRLVSHDHDYSGHGHTLAR